MSNSNIIDTATKAAEGLRIDGEPWYAADMEALIEAYRLLAAELAQARSEQDALRAQGSYA